ASCPACSADNFTPDGSHAFVIHPIDNSPEAGGSGPLQPFEVTTGRALAPIGKRVWSALALGRGSGAASELLVVEAGRAGALATGYKYAFARQTLEGPPTALGGGVERLGLDAARSVVVYSIPGAGDLSGIWVVQL